MSIENSSDYENGELMMDEFERILLETLSFYRFYTLPEILIEMNQEILEQFPNLSMQNLEERLKILTKKKKLKMTLVKGQESWIRIIDKKKFFKFGWWNF